MQLVRLVWMGMVLRPNEFPVVSVCCGYYGDQAGRHIPGGSVSLPRHILAVNTLFISTLQNSVIFSVGICSCVFDLGILEKLFYHLLQLQKATEQPFITTTSSMSGAFSVANYFFAVVAASKMLSSKNYRTATPKANNHRYAHRVLPKLFHPAFCK